MEEIIQYLTGWQKVAEYQKPLRGKPGSYRTNKNLSSLNIYRTSNAW